MGDLAVGWKVVSTVNVVHGTCVIACGGVVGPYPNFLGVQGSSPSLLSVTRLTSFGLALLWQLSQCMQTHEVDDD
jgi:hypothetical protein